VDETAGVGSDEFALSIEVGGMMTSSAFFARLISERTMSFSATYLPTGAHTR